MRFLELLSLPRKLPQRQQFLLQRPPRLPQSLCRLLKQHLQLRPVPLRPVLLKQVLLKPLLPRQLLPPRKSPLPKSLLPKSLQPKRLQLRRPQLKLGPRNQKSPTSGRCPRGRNRSESSLGPEFTPGLCLTHAWK